jgi:peptidoglycan/LPS O-acetylase OafA/YrhL
MPEEKLTLSHPKYRPDIDGLRAIAVISVVVFHAFPDFIKGGFIGVDLFFVISGFLISTIIFENLQKNSFSFTTFYARRVKRIFPALFIVLLSCITFGWLVLLPEELNQLGKHVAGGAGFISNFVSWNEAGYFDNSGESKPLLHLWSLGIEEQFYLAWPLIVWALWKKNLNIFTITLLALILSFYFNASQIGVDATGTFYSPLSRFWELLAGSLMAWTILNPHPQLKDGFLKIDFLVTKVLFRDRQVVTNDGSVFTNLLSIVGSLLLIIGFMKIDKGAAFPGHWALLPVLGACFIVGSGANTWLNRTILSHRVLIWIGLISFPLYLWHWPLLTFASIIENGEPSATLRTIMVFLSVILAWLTTILIERPIRFTRSLERAKVTALCVLITLVGISGYIISKTDFSKSHGFETRLIKREGFEHGVGTSLKWYHGKDNWLFLGNDYADTVAKLKLAIDPDKSKVSTLVASYTALANTATANSTQIGLLLAPNKSSVYPEYLPDTITPAKKRYATLITDELSKINGLVVYDPTDDLKQVKRSQGLLYMATDTHWNSKGAYFAYVGFLNQFGLPHPKVNFENVQSYKGDLIGISGLTNHPLSHKDNWKALPQKDPSWTEEKLVGQKDAAFGSPSIVVNSAPLIDKRVWIIGDSFTNWLKPFFNTTFKEVHYLGHWSANENALAAKLKDSEKKPDYIFVVRVERSL